MNKNKLITLFLFNLLLLTALLGGCSSAGPVRTLDSLDIRQSTWATDDVFVEPKSEDEVKAAYDNYIQHSVKGDSSRLLAIHRLAEIEIDRLNALMIQDDTEPDDAILRASLERTRDLLQSSLQEFPDASNNDETLYQLARVLDQLDLANQSIDALSELSAKHPDSRHYPETQFRLAEAAFAKGDYISAEDSYSDVLMFDSRQLFHERALFKRGWSRYKQGLYMEAVDDYLAAIKGHPSDRSVHITGDKPSDLDEYYRAIGLSFASLQDPSALQQYFVGGPDEQYLYPVYQVISDTYLQQERYSDAAGLLRQFVELNPTSSSVPLAELQIVQIWRSGGFRTLFLEALEDFYDAYHPKHHYWGDHASLEKEAVLSALREISLELASYYHERFLSSRHDTDFNQAQRWYEIYLEHYSGYAQQDKLYIAYAELLALSPEKIKALHYFELAAYDGDIILDKESAYATIVLSSDLLHAEPQNAEWLRRQTHYALLSARLYPDEVRYHTATLHAAESASKAGQYDAAIQLLDALSDSADEQLLYRARVLEGLAYREMGRFPAAEGIFAELLQGGLNHDARQEQLDNLAVVIFRQAEHEASAANEAAALQHYSRVAQLTPDSALAPVALYEAIILSMNQQNWHQAIQSAELFKQRYADHELSNDAMRQASAAYLNAGDKEKAAQAFEQLAAQDDSREVQMAALWQAAELHESSGDTESAIRSYRRYAHNYNRPYPQYMEAMHRLSELYKTTGETDKRKFWQEKIMEADQQTPRSEKTSRSNYIAASAFLELGNRRAQAFRQHQLTAPLAENLRIKKQLLQESSTLLGRASAYGFTDVSTEATYLIATIYQDFAESLLNSERPAELRGEELVQYDILLEDQAFPFEEKAIEFYEVNLARVKDGASGQWVIESHQQLAALFPARYRRNGKVDIYRNE